MKQETVYGIKNVMANQLVIFNNALYGCPRTIDKDMKESISKICDMVDALNKQNVDDFDLWVFVKYREGKMRSKYVKHVKLEPKTLLQSIDEGFRIPVDATLVEIEIKAVIKNDYDVRVVRDKNIYETRFGISKGEELTPEQLKRRYGLEANENLFSQADLQENSKILKFYKRKDLVKKIIDNKKSNTVGL